MLMMCQGAIRGPHTHTEREMGFQEYKCIHIFDVPLDLAKSKVNVITHIPFLLLWDRYVYFTSLSCDLPG